jgi:hypothetical protein
MSKVKKASKDVCQSREDWEKDQAELKAYRDEKKAREAVVATTKQD